MSHLNSQSAGKSPRLHSDIADSGWWPTRTVSRDSGDAITEEADRLFKWPEGQAMVLLSASSLGGLEEIEESLAAYGAPAEEPPSRDLDLATPVGMEIPPPSVALREVKVAPVAAAALQAPDVDTARDIGVPTETAPSRGRQVLRRLFAAATVTLIVGAVAVARYQRTGGLTQADFQPVRLLESTPAADLPALLQSWSNDTDKAQQIRQLFPQVSEAVRNKGATLALLPGDQALAALAQFTPDDLAAGAVARQRLERVVHALAVSVQQAASPPEGVAEIAAQLHTVADENPQIVTDSIDTGLDYEEQDAVRYELAKAFHTTAAADLLQAERRARLYGEWDQRFENGGVLAATAFLKPQLAQRDNNALFVSHLPRVVADLSRNAEPRAHAFALAALRDVYRDDETLARAHLAASENAALASLSRGRVESALAYYRARSADPAGVPAPRFLIDVLQTAERELPLQRQLALYAEIEESAAFPEQQVVADHRREVLMRRARQAIADGTFVLDAVQWQSDVVPQSFRDILQTAFPAIEDGLNAKSLDRKAMQALIRHARAREEAELATRLTVLRDHTWPPKVEVKEAETAAPARVPLAAAQTKPKPPSATILVTGPAEGHTKITARLTNAAGEAVANAHVQVQLNIGAANVHSFVGQTNGEGVAEFNVTRYIVTTRDLPPAMKFTYRVSAIDLDAKSVEVSVTIGELVERFW